MSNNWGPYFIVPSEAANKFSGIVVLRENFDEELLRKELDQLGLSGAVVRVVNPWYYRKKGTETWIKIGESENKDENFPTKWDTSSGLENGEVQSSGQQDQRDRDQDTHRCRQKSSRRPISWHVPGGHRPLPDRPLYRDGWHRGPSPERSPGRSLVSAR